MKTRICFLLASSIALAASASAQVDVFRGTSPNAAMTLDFDNPFVASGPILGNDPAFTGVGISSVAIVGVWTAAGDALTAGSNVMGQGLVIDAGGLAVGTTGDPLDGAGAGAGFEFTLTTAVDEFGLAFIDQTNMRFDVELFMGATSLGVSCGVEYDGPFPVPSYHFRGPSPFDRVLITFPVGSGGVGVDNITLGNGPPPASATVPDNCVETTFLGGNGGNDGGAVYFDLTANSAIEITEIWSNYSTIAGDLVGIEVYTAPNTSVGFEDDPNAWTLVGIDDGTALAAGAYLPTILTLAAPITIQTGTVGIALVAVGSPHGYTNGVGCNQDEASVDGRFSIALGTASNVPFTATIFSPRLWNGRLCAGSAAPGINYCGPGVANSTGNSGVMSASGSTSVAANTLVLEGSDLPNNSFAFFVTSLTQGFVAGPGGSLGNLCLGGQIGRYVGPGQIQQVSGGTIALAIDLTLIPQPMGFVSVAPGEAWNFQAWHRDSVGGMAVSNFTDGLEITFTN